MPQKGIQGQQIEELTLDLTGVDGAGITNVDAVSISGLVVGTGANNLVQLDALSRLPAVDGSLLSNLPSGGLFVETNAADFGLANGSSNIIGGLYAGQSLIGGNNNFIAGHNAGQYATDITASILIGTNAGRFLGTDDSNIIIGSHAAGSTHTHGQSNIVIGGGAGVSLSGATARFNVFVGGFVAADATGGTCSNNVAVGNQALQTVTSGSSNVVLGNSAGNKIVAGGANICIGIGAGPTTDQSNKLFIDTTETDTPLIGADFLTNTVNIEGDMEVSGNVVSHLNINSQFGTTYTLIATDDGSLIPMNNAAANVVTIPTNASVPFSIGTQILVSQAGAGQTSIAGPGVTLNSAGGLLSTASQFSTLSLIKTAIDTWLISGDLV